MSDANALQELIDRAAISDMVHAYATAVDTRDWELFRSLFVDPLLLDFSSFHPSLKREITVDELLEIADAAHLHEARTRAADGEVDVGRDGQGLLEVSRAALVEGRAVEHADAAAALHEVTGAEIGGDDDLFQRPRIIAGVAAGGDDGEAAAGEAAEKRMWVHAQSPYR